MGIHDPPCTNLSSKLCLGAALTSCLPQFALCSRAVCDWLVLCLGGGQATPLRPGRHLHILEDGEDAEEEADAAAEPEDDGQLDEEAPMHQIDEADSNDYGLNPEQLWHLQPEHWRGAVINSAPPPPAQ